jgi:hypothetical protein
VTSLELLRREFERTSAPGDHVVHTARARLMAEIELNGASRHAIRTRRPLLFKTVVVLAACGLVAAVLAFVLPGSGGLSGTEIAAAAARAMTPPQNVIRHWTSHTVLTRISPGHRTVTTIDTVNWTAGDRPYVLHERSTTSGDLFFEPSWAARQEIETTACGQVVYFPRRNLLGFDGPPESRDLSPVSDPANDYLDAYRRGAVRYGGKTTFREIASLKLVVVLDGYETTYIVRQDDYEPLQVVSRYLWQSSYSKARRNVVEVTTYSPFELIPRNASSEHLLHISPPGGVSVRGERPDRPACGFYGSLESLRRASSRK